jgi:hypothetical protein
VNPEQRYLRHAEYLALTEAARAHPAEDAMRGLDLDGKGRSTGAHGALVAAFMISRGEPMPQSSGLFARIPKPKAENAHPFRQ